MTAAVVARLAEIDSEVWRLRGLYLNATWAVDAAEALRLTGEIDELLRERWQLRPATGLTLPG